MKLTLAEPKYLKESITIISDLVNEARFKINKDAIELVAMDPANVAMVNFKIPKSSFSQFEVEKEVLGINLDNLKQILRRCGSGSSLIIEKKENLLSIHIQDRIKRNFTLNLIEIESEERDLPELEFSSLVEMNSVDLITSIEDCNIVADACSFIIKDGKFIIEAKSLNSAMSEFSGDEAKIEAENCKAKYSLEYLQKFMKGAKLCEKSVLRFAEEHPLRIDFKTPEMELSFILAPRVETDD
ncbi:proliferating cell nuclear antigen (pcna) [candidate division KSB1 bacterium]|nr:proliferating cell nuclear antigen (pcna) [candidate division KSB1 bacterium]